MIPSAPTSSANGAFFKERCNLVRQGGFIIAAGCEGWRRVTLSENPWLPAISITSAIVGSAAWAAPSANTIKSNMQSAWTWVRSHPKTAITTATVALTGAAALYIATHTDACIQTLGEVERTLLSYRPQPPADPLLSESRPALPSQSTIPEENHPTPQSGPETVTCIQCLETVEAWLTGSTPPSSVASELLPAPPAQSENKPSIPTEQPLPEPLETAKLQEEPTTS